MSKHGEKKQGTIAKTILKILIVLVLLASIVGVIYVANKNYTTNEIKNKTNLIINNSNVTTSLKADIYVKDGIVYLSKADIANFFDSTIYYDETYNQMITCSEKKIATMPLGKQEIEINSAKTKINGCLIKQENTYYIPLSELGDVYNMKITYIEETNRVTVDSLDKSYAIATAKKDISVKYKPTGISKTLAKVKKGDSITIATHSQYPTKDGWTRVRTGSGILGYVKTNSIGETNQIRETMETKPKIEGKVSLVWDFYSKYATAPNRKGTTIEGVNVVSPAFFYLEQQGKGNIKSNIGEQGKSYISWAKEQGYQIWPMFANDSAADTTSQNLRDYKIREKMINQIVDYIVSYNLDGINIDFENMYEADKSYFSRFLIELEPRLNEIGAVLSVDVTAPDGAPNWSLCYDRYTIGKVADYIIFMAYDQYGESSTKAGTTAGHDWIEVNVQKFLGQEGVPSNKLVLAVPFYTRLWQEKNDKIVKKPVVDMKNVNQVLPDGVEKKWNEDLKQYYVEYVQNDTTYKMWVEDEKSITEKLNLVSKYNLAGAAYWAKGRETQSVWNIIAEKIK